MAAQHSPPRAITIRVRSRDGLERVKIDPSATVGDLKQVIRSQLLANQEDNDNTEETLALSQDSKLLTTRDDVGFCPESFSDMSDDSATLQSLGITANGHVVHMLTSERQVQGVKLPEFMKRSFGAHMTIDDMVARQTRIERQDAAECSSASFDMHAANVFQSYIQSAMAFSIKRGGILYGEVDDDKNVLIHAIYEPPQQGSQDELDLDRNTGQEELADRIAAVWGWKKVGWVFSQSTKEREYIFSAQEVMQMAAIQEEMGDTAVTAVVALLPPEEEGDVQEVHFEAFQVSKQCVKLHKEGWFELGEAPNEFKARNPNDPRDKTPIIVARKDVDTVDVDYFLVPVGIKDHESVVMSSFAVENRLLPQGPAELKAHLDKHSGLAFSKALKDFHLMLYVADKAGFGPDEVESIAAAVWADEPIPDGYIMIIKGMAGCR
jgi:nuclear protein localization family protein 4